MIFVSERQSAFTRNGIAGSLQKRQKRIEVLRLLFKGGVYRHTEQITVRQLIITAKPFVIAQPVFLRILYNGQPVFCANLIGELSDCPIASDEVAELPRAVQGRGVPVDMIMDMGFICVGADKKRMVSF